MSISFSVVIATYNRPHLVVDAVASVLAQTIADLECIVVDDGSHTAKAVLPDDDRIRLLDLDDNAGLAHAWNTGVQAAQGDAVAFLDDDDLWTPNRLELAAQGLERADIAVCGAGWIGGGPPAPSRPLNGDVHDRILDRFTPNMGRTAVRRPAFLPFDERYRASQDVEWWLRQSKVASVATVDQLGHLSRRHDGVRHLNGTQARIDSAHRMLADHADYFAAHPRARAFRQYRIGQFQSQLGNLPAARQAWTTSLRSRPSWRATRSLASSLLPRPRPTAS